MKFVRYADEKQCLGRSQQMKERRQRLFLTGNSIGERALALQHKRINMHVNREEWF